MLVALQSFQASSDRLDRPYWINIDCGATSSHQDEINVDLTWETDDEFITTGDNKFLLDLNTSFVEMKTLRSFPSGTTNCYNLRPLIDQGKYLVRAGFVYGNYDGLLKPPTFVLQLVGYSNVTVTTSATNNEPIYHEFFIFTKAEVVDVCLVQTQQGNVPFISTLEITFIDYESYTWLNNKTAFYLESRINYGANQTVPERFNYSADVYNRIWKREEVPSYPSISVGDRDPNAWSTGDNYPPYAILWHAIESHNTSESISLQIKFHDKSQLSAYFIFYFSNIPHDSWNRSETRKVAIYIDGQEKNITDKIPGYYEIYCLVVPIYPVNVTGGTANVTITAAQGSTLPPILNAMEVFSEYDVSKADYYHRRHIPFLGFSFALFFCFVYWLLE
ncbi:Malectin-like carbohydrate-binding domain containing protein [Trema orientale]|uniref:Malectin-like carbohydrate-binding domain containing protein n=1 Tax=Trema orientale TaxID=63057 RepID=A0A2P5ATJ4_TREOI|nr:Malectin-like carbohydrate-binding domain containing protein [Trema orientale]